MRIRIKQLYAWQLDAFHTLIYVDCDIMLMSTVGLCEL
jgi:hypothetical protein